MTSGEFFSTAITRQPHAGSLGRSNHFQRLKTEPRSLLPHAFSTLRSQQILNYAAYIARIRVGLIVT